MIIAMIKGASRICGKAQGYMGLPIRDMVIIDKATGGHAPAMETAWTPTPDELARLNKGANVIARILGHVPPPMLLSVDMELPEPIGNTYKAVPPRFPSIADDWTVEREYSCINGLSCWFIIATIEETTEVENGYTDGKIGTAEERATKIAAALNGSS